MGKMAEDIDYGENDMSVYSTWIHFYRDIRAAYYFSTDPKKNIYRNIAIISRYWPKFACVTYVNGFKCQHRIIWYEYGKLLIKR